MDNTKHQLASETISIQQIQKQQNKLPEFQQPQPKLIQKPRETISSKENGIDNRSQQSQMHQSVTSPSPPKSPPPQSAPKVTVSLPKHVASRLLDLVQKRDIELLKLGIISVQFENDQIIPLNQNQNNIHLENSMTQHKQHQPQNRTIISSASNEIIADSKVKDCNDMVEFQPNSLTRTITGLPVSPIGPILECEDEDQESIDNLKLITDNVPTSYSSSILNNRPTMTTAPNSKAIEPKQTVKVNPDIRSIATPTVTMTNQNSDAARNQITIPKLNNCNTNNNNTTATTASLAVVYVEDDDNDEKDDFETVVSEVEPQHSNYNIHQLSQLEFADPIEVEMYENDNDLLFPDYTLNLS